MILKIARKNVWRNRGRSMVVIGSVIVGIWALIFGTGFTMGFLESYMSESINHDVSNIQIHNPKFKEDYDINYFIEDGQHKVEELSGWEGVKAATARVIVNGMISSSRKGLGVQIRGIDIAKEAAVTRLDSLLTEGTYFTGIKRNPLIIGEKLAEELKVKLRSKVVLTFNDANGNLTATAFRIVGIIKSSSLKLNERTAFVKMEDLFKNLANGNHIHEIAVVTNDQADEEAIAKKYNQLHPEDKAETWREIAPELAVMQDMYSQTLYVLLVIIMLALVFGIVNTMLMAVLERTRELGMLMAVGMNKVRVYTMVVIETIYLSVIGAPIGLLLGYLTILYFGNVGVDLSNYSEGLQAFGSSSVLYPYVSNETYLVITVSVVITAITGALYPAWKAIKLNPVEALHKV